MDKRQQKKIKVVTSLTVFALLGAALGLLYYGTRPSKSTAELFTLMKKSYDEGNFDQTKSLSMGHWPELIQVEDGCELLVSTFAFLKDFDSLWTVSLSCHQAGKGLGISQEALAYAAKSLGRLNEGIQILKEKTNVSQSDRAVIALAWLYFYKEEFVDAKREFLAAIITSEIWSVWLTQVLRLEALMSDIEFVAKLVATISAKERSFPTIEKKLYDRAKKLKIKDLDQLQKRLTSPPK